MSSEKFLKRVLQKYNIFPSNTNLQLRCRVVDRLKSLLQEFMKKCLSKSETKNLKCRMMPFGSYRLGTDTQYSDIDILCVVPKQISKDNFFSLFPDFLKKAKNVTVTNIVSHPEAYVPVIQCSFDGIGVDLILARIDFTYRFKFKDLNDSLILDSLDEESLRSINALRGTDDIINRVPNLDNFRLTLQAIKLWAKQRGIYSNILGFLGGAGWTLLVASICQIFPKDTPATLIYRFFYEFTKWDWVNPVELTKPKNYKSLQKPKGDPIPSRKATMAIYTTVYPETNVSYNVNKTTLQVIKKEFHDAFEHLRKEKSFRKFFQPPRFFQKYEHYIVLEVSTANNRDHVEMGEVDERNIRHYVLDLGRHSWVNIAHSWPKAYTSRGSKYWFIGIEINSVDKIQDLSRSIKEFQHVMSRKYPDLDVVGEVKEKDQMFSYVAKLDEEYLKDFTGHIDEDQVRNTHVVEALRTETEGDGSLDSMCHSL